MPRPDAPSRRSPLPDVVLYADGACSGNPGPGGWAALLIHPSAGRRLEIYGYDRATTNNRMEMQAVIEGLQRLRQPSRVKVVTDSKYLVQGMNEWVTQWKRNGWKTAARKAVKNRELWEELLRLEALHVVSFEWIEGHSGHPENERCDQLAVEAYQKRIKSPH